jgi:c(7)-type cytochrome triheme protein
VRNALLLGAAMMLAASLALGQNMPKLPQDLTLPQTGDSPGKVTFSHANHVGFQVKADCTACHPKLAPILKQQKAAGNREAITHAKMEKGQACGACHNGKAAHGFDDCTTCHKG